MPFCLLWVFFFSPGFGLGREIRKCWVFFFFFREGIFVVEFNGGFCWYLLTPEEMARLLPWWFVMW